jgi:hypothetical protein
LSRERELIKRPRSAEDRGLAPAFTQLSCRSFRGLAYHGVFDYADHHGDDRTEDAATYGLSDDGTDVHVLGSSGEQGQEGGENLRGGVL